MMETTVVTAHIPNDLSKRIDKVAQRMDRSKGWIVKQALENWILDEDEKHRLTMEAIREADEGKVVPHAVVQQWWRETSASR